MATLASVLADAMDLPQSERAALARYLAALAAGGIELDSDSVRASTDAELAALLG